ncbi:MAG TPA: protein kinase [Blastocatellia bacterium]|nr:protein kinase [Blastocatellia bacterium]
MIGKIIGNYEITSELAQGGMGAVYRGRHLHLPREVVVKSILLGAFSPSAQDHLRARFRREAFVQSQLDHPNIVRVYEFFAAEENYYLVMEYVSGMSLRDLLSRQGPPTPAQAVYLLKQALAALDYAHDFRSQDEADYRQTGVIHRDIKPANMLLDAKGRLKITDFGIVKVLGEQTEFAMTQSGFQPGTVEYMSPEQLLGQEIDARSDLYSLGVTFYEMLTGRLPFRRSATGSDWEIRKGHIELEPPSILEIRPEIHPQLAAIIMSSMGKKPGDRYQSAADFIEAVMDYERTYAEKGQALRSPEVKVTQPQTAPLTAKAMKSTMMDEAATLLARPRDESAPPHKSHLEDQDAIPTKAEESSPARPLEYQAAPVSPGQFGTEISRIDVTRPAQPGQTKRRWPLAVGAAGLLLAGTAAGAILFSRRSSTESAPRTEAAKVETPTPTMAPASSPPARPALKPKPATATAKPTPTPVEKMNYKLAQGLEQQERYADAANVYEDYLVRSPNAPDANVVTSYRDGLRKIQDALTAAESAMNARMYPLARKHYQRALTLRPESQRAKAGLDEAEAKIQSSLPPRVKRDLPFGQGDFPRGGERQKRPGQPERQEPPDQPPPARIFRRVVRPTPTPRERYP